MVLAWLNPVRKKKGLAILAAVTLVAVVFISGHTADAACATLPTDKGTITASAAAPSTGTYYIWSRNKTTTASNNGYYLQVDSNCGMTVGDANIPVNTWTWVNYQGGNTNNRMTVSLTAGTHSFKFYGLDPGVQVDRLVLTADASCTPTGTGDNCTNATTTPPIIVTNPTPGTSQSVAGTVQIGSSNTNSKTTVKVDGKVLASGNGLVGLDTSQLADGFHDVTVEITNPDGSVQTVTKRILVQNNLPFWNKAYNWLYKTLGYNKLLTNIIVFILAVTMISLLGVGLMLAWSHRLWEKLPLVKKVHLPFLHVPSALKRSMPVVDPLDTVGAATGAVVGDVQRSHAGRLKFKLGGHTFSPNLPAIATIMVFALFGSAAILYGVAGANSFVVEPEAGTKTVVSTIADSSAAGGSYIQFGTGTCPAGQTGTPPNCVTPPATCPAGQTGTPPNCVTPPPPTNPPVTGAVPCGLNAAAESCWANKTGVKNGTGYTEAQIVAGQSNLTKRTGQLIISTPGTVIDRMWIDGCIAVRASNVTIKNSLVRGSANCLGGKTISINAVISTGDNGGAGVSGLKVIDTEIDGLGNAGDSLGVGQTEFTCTRCNIHGTAKGAKGDQNVTVEESYIHNLANDHSTHTEGFFYDGGAGHIMVNHSWIKSNDDFSTAAVSFNNDYAGHYGTVTNSYLEGAGGADLTCGAFAGKPAPFMDHIVITNNAFSPHNAYGGTVFYYGCTLAPAGNVWSGNYNSETKAVIAGP